VFLKMAIDLTSGFLGSPVLYNVQICLDYRKIKALYL
jgi:hypothetical protein